MRRITPAFRLLLAGLLASQAAFPAVRYYDVTGSTASAENACPIWVPADSEDDCSYNASNPSTAGTAQWLGPVFSAGYYAPGDAPPIYTNPAAPVPVLAPAPQLPTGGKTGIPIARGFVSIDDKGTAAGTDDVIGGTLEFGPFERNVGTGPAARMLESFDRIIHRFIVPAGSTVSGATANAAGGFDYIVGVSGGSAVFPSVLSGTTTAAGGFADAFPSEVASQSSTDPADVPYWPAPGANGISRIEGTTAVAGLRTEATVWGYGCSADAAAAPCLTSDVNWDGDSRARYDNVLLRLSTDDAGHITAALAYLVNESDLSPTVFGNDSWNATTLALTGTEDPLPAAFDDRILFVNDASDTVTFVDINALANDAPGAGTPAVAVTTPPAHGTAEPTGSANVIRYTPAVPESAFEGVDTFAYRITDGSSATATGTVAVTRTDPITCANDPQTPAPGTPITVDVLANDAGFDIPPVVLSLASLPSWGTAVVNPDRTITFTPASGVAVDDEESLEDFVTRNIAVLGNDRLSGPVAFNYRINDGTNLPAVCLVTIDDGTDALISPVAIEITDMPDHGQAFVLPAAGNQAATIRYTSNDGYAGQDTLRYQLRDPAGFVSNVATVTITVSDSTPVAIDDAPTAEDGVPTTLFVMANDTDGVDLPLTLAITAQPAHGTATVTEASGSSQATLRYTSAAGFTGTDTLTYTVTDADGDVSNAATVTITVRDSVPVAAADNVNGDARTEASLDVVANDTDRADVPITIEITQAPASGAASVVPASGTTTGRPAILYESNPGTAAADSLRYRLRDADGDVSNEVTVTINVTDATPVAVNDPTAPAEIIVEDGATLGIGVLNNDTGLVNPPLTLTITQQPANGTVTIVTGTPLSSPVVNYRPRNGFTGGDTFSYRVTDGDGDASNVAVVTLTVRDSAPVANPDTANGDSRTATAVDVLANDTQLSDGPVTIEITGQPTNGTAEIVTVALASGTRPGIAYASTPMSTFNGNDVVRYRVTDRDGDVSNETTLTLSVANLTPVAVNDVGGDEGLGPVGQVYVVAGVTTPFDVLHNDTGRGNRPVTLTITTAPLHGTAVVDSAEDTGIGRPGISYTSNDGYSGPDGFSYTFTDGDDQVSNVATVSFEVVNILTATSDGSPIPLATNEGKPLTVDVLDNDGGLSVGPITIEIVTAVSGTATVNADNTVTFQPDPGFTGRFPSPECPPSSCFSSAGGGFRYRIIDGLNQSSEASTFVDVFPPPETKQDSGGSALDSSALALLLGGLAIKHRRRRLIRQLT